MATCYLLYSVWWNGDYNSHVDVLEEVSLNESTLLNIKNGKEFEQSANNLLYIQVQELKSIYDELYGHTRPSWPSHLLKKVPKWKQGLRKEEITQEMRDERDRINEENARVSQQHSDAVNAWDEARDTHIRQTLNLPDDFDVYHLRESDLTWKIESKELV